jgi:hypothetical protein
MTANTSCLISELNFLELLLKTLAMDVMCLLLRQLCSRLSPGAACSLVAKPPPDSTTLISAALTFSSPYPRTNPSLRLKS